MSHITDNEEEPFEDPVLRRRSIKETMTVCPKCFSPTKRIPTVFTSSRYSCTNSECGWAGSLVIEVDREEYQEFMLKQANQKNE